MSTSKQRKSSPKNPKKNKANKNSGTANADKKNKQLTTDEELPAYLNYPPEEDILNPSNRMERVDLDVENITHARNIAAPDQESKITIPPPNAMEWPIPEDIDQEADLGKPAASEADVSK